MYASQAARLRLPLADPDLVDACAQEPRRQGMDQHVADRELVRQRDDQNDGTREAPKVGLEVVVGVDLSVASPFP